MLTFEKHSEPLITQEEFLVRVARHASIALLIIVGSLALGIFGYHFLEDFSWLDSLLNASMILGGMGPVDTLNTDVGKIFASFYALYSGIIFLVIAGVIFAPVLHRFLHKFHLDNE